MTEYFRIFDRLNGLRPCILTICALLTCIGGCTSFKHLTVSGDDFARGKDCGKCHVDIYHEWSGSDHAAAYANPHFRKATNDYAFEDCLSCHAPGPLAANEQPTLRSAGREDGVTCVTCHLDQGKMWGPIEPTGKVAPHPIGVSPEFYSSSSLCGRCHEGTYEEWTGVQGDKKTCQQCHMEAVTRKVTQATGGISNILVAMEKQVPQRRHLFSIPAGQAAEDMISAGIVREGSSSRLTVTNNLPHYLPTGDFGFRVVDLEVFAMDSEGLAISLARWELAKESGTGIPPRSRREWPVDLPADTQSLRIVLTRHSYDQEVMTLTEVEAPLQ